MLTSEANTGELLHVGVLPNVLVTFEVKPSTRTLCIPGKLTTNLVCACDEIEGLHLTGAVGYKRYFHNLHVQIENILI